MVDLKDAKVGDMLVVCNNGRITEYGRVTRITTKYVCVGERRINHKGLQVGSGPYSGQLFKLATPEITAQMDAQHARRSLQRAVDDLVTDVLSHGRTRDLRTDDLEEIRNALRAVQERRDARTAAAMVGVAP